MRTGGQRRGTVINRGWVSVSTPGKQDTISAFERNIQSIILEINAQIN